MSNIDVKPKGRRGYSTHGYPVVWLKTLTHEQCLEKLGKKKEVVEVVPTDEKTLKSGKVAGVSFAITCEDDRNITLKAGSITTYHRDMESVINMLRQHVEKAQVRDEKVITSLDKLTEIVQKTKELVRKALS